MTTSLDSVTAGRESIFRSLLRRPPAVVSALIILMVLVSALWPHQWLPHNPEVPNPDFRFVPPLGMNGSEWTFPLGTDVLGRDILSMLIAGARTTLVIVLGAAAISVLIGVVTGLWAGYFGKAVDATIMRLADIQLSFPNIILVIAIVAAFGPSVPNLIVVLGVTGWAPYARLVRGTVLSLREKEFIEAAQITGVGNARILFRHLLPNTTTGIVVFLTSDVASLVLLEASLSFLGLGVQPPSASWGLMIAEGRQYIYDSAWASIIPGVVIVLVVLAFNFLGDEIRDALDPTSERR